MATTKLTLSAEEKVVRKARQLAKRNKTSISAMFSRWVLAMSSRQDKKRRAPLGPLTRRALGLAKLPADTSDRHLLEEALAEKYGIDQ